MIIKGKSRTGGKALGDYLLQDKNDRVTVFEAFGYEEGHSLQDILTDFERTASGSQCEQPLYHVQIRTPEGEKLTREQWIKTADRLQAALKMDEHERLIVFHEFNGHEHAHVVFNRMNPETGKAAELSHDGYARMQVAREMEREFGLKELSSERTGRLSAKEEQIAKRYGKDPQEIKAHIQTAWKHAENGQELITNLAEYDYVLARGDRRDYLVVDLDGNYYALGRVVGEKAAAVRNFMSDMDRESLPTLEQAREMQKDLSYKLEHGEKARQEPDKAEIEKGKKRSEMRAQVANDVCSVWKESGKNGLDFLVSLQQKGLYVAQDKDQVVIIQDNGFIHFLGGKQYGKTAQEIQEGMAATLKECQGLLLPTVDQCRETIQEQRAKERKDREISRSSNLSRTQANIRMAYVLTQGGQQFAGALEDKGLSLAQVTKEEAQNTEIIHRMFSKDKTKDFIPSVLREGELVVVNEYGSVYRLNERTTGDNRREMTERLSEIDRAELLTLYEAKDVSLDIQKYREGEKKLKRSKGRPRFADLYDRAGMAHQQADAVRHIKKRNKTRKFAERLKEGREETGAQKSADTRDDKTSVEEKENSVEDIRRKFWDKIRTAADATRADREGHTEKGDRQQGKEERDSVKEKFEHLGRGVRGRGDDDDGGRERER